MRNSRKRRDKGGAPRPGAADAAVGAGFSLPSFVAGLGVGAIAAVTALYAIEGEDAEAPAAQPPPVASVATSPVSYEFWERLPSERLGQVPPRPPASPAVAVSPQPADAARQPAEAASAPAEQASSPAADATPREAAERAVAAAVPPTAPARTEYLLQVGAFREAGAADKRRAELLLAGMEAQTTSIGVEDGVLYRVIVGPFPSMRETRRAMGALQERSIAPILLERAARSG